MSPEPLTRSESRSTLQRISPEPATEALPVSALKSLASMSPEPAIEKLTDSVLPLIFTSPEPFYVNGAYLRFGSAAVNISRTGYVYHENISLYSGKLYIAGSGCGDCDIFLSRFMTPAFEVAASGVANCESINGIQVAIDCKIAATGR